MNNIPPNWKKMSSHCKAAIIIPGCNEEAYIRNCLNSINNAISFLKNPKSIEIIFVNNNSVDNTEKIVKTFKKKHKHINIFILNELKQGQGYARQTGVRTALTRMLLRKNSRKENFWIINTDADVIVPTSWLTQYFNYFDKKKSLIIIGNSKFGFGFDKRYPNYLKVLTEISNRIKKAEKLFGVINVDGFNSAIEEKCYGAIGPFYQPVKRISKNKVVNLAGEDWDLGTRARSLGIIPTRMNPNPVISSPRRFESSPQNFLDGTTYEGPFGIVNSSKSTIDIQEKDITNNINIGSLRICVHFIEKPILIDPKLLNSLKVKKLFGKKLTTQIKKWINDTKKPDLFQERNKFFIDYLHSFHSKFGPLINNALFKRR